MRSIILLIMIIFVLLFVAPSSGLMMPLSMKELTDNSDLVVIGTVIGAESVWVENNTSIQTRVIFQDETVLKGNVFFNNSITIITHGGSVGDVQLYVEDEPLFRINQTYGVFLISNPPDYFVFGKCQGLFVLCEENPTQFSGKDQINCISKEEFSEVVQAALNGEDPELIKTNDFLIPQNRMALAAQTGGPHIDSITPDNANAGTGEIIRISGSGFGQKLSRDSYADVWFYFTHDSNYLYPIWASGFCYGDPNWKGDNPNAIVSWSDTEIKTKLPVGYAFDGLMIWYESASSGPVRVLTEEGIYSNYVPITVGFSYVGAKWPGSNPKCIYYINSQSSDFRLAIINAAETWNRVSGKNFEFLFFGNTNSNIIEYNGKNEIIWGNTQSPYSLAEAYVWTNSGGPRGDIIEADIVYNKYAQWSPNPGPSEYDIQTTALHELGHWLKLLDLYGDIPGYPSDETEIMYGFSFIGAIKHTLGSDDIEGIRYIYPGVTPSPTITTLPTTTVTPTPSPTTIYPTPTPTSSPILVNFTASHTSGTAPLTVKFQDTSQGDPMGWMWDINGDGFKDYSERNCEHTYTSPGDYTVTLSVTRYSELFTVTRTNYIHVIPTTPTTIPSPSPTVTMTTIPTTSPPSGGMTVNLHSGWNLISTPKTLADGHRTAGEVFSGINTDGHSIYRYNAQSQSWIQVNSNNDIQPLQGLWIYSKAPGQVSFIFKNDQTPSPGILMSPGWNSIGFTRTTPVSAREALLPVQYAWTQLFGFNAESQAYESSIINGGTGSHSDTNLIYPGKGYWIFMNGQGTLT